LVDIEKEENTKIKDEPIQIKKDLAKRKLKKLMNFFISFLYNYEL